MLGWARLVRYEARESLVMDRLTFSPTSSGFTIDDYPDAVAVVAVDDESAERIQDLALHERDLAFARACLDAIPKVADELGVVHHALWRATIVHFIKCFSTGARERLDRDIIYARIEKADIALQCFDYFSTLRNRHVVHDVNDYTQAAAGAVINRRDAPYKIEKIVCISLVGETLDQQGYSNLYLLIDTAAAWVRQRLDELCVELTDELEALEYDRLIKMPPLTQTAPKLEAIERARKQAKSPAR